MKVANPQEELALSEITPELIDAAALITAKSFLDSPAYVALFNVDKEQRFEILKTFFKMNIEIMRGAGAKNATRCLRNPDDNSVLCSFMLANTRHSPNIVSLFWKMVIPLFRKVGIVPTMKAMWIGMKVDKQLDEIMEGREFIILERMVVHPDCQGKGIGSKCLALAMQESGFKDLPWILMTQLEINVKFYQNLGFKIVKEFDSTVNGLTFHSWVMIKEVGISSD